MSIRMLIPPAEPWYAIAFEPKEAKAADPDADGRRVLGLPTVRHPIVAWAVSDNPGPDEPEVFGMVASGPVLVPAHTLALVTYVPAEYRDADLRKDMEARVKRAADVTRKFIQDGIDEDEAAAKAASHTE